jgi:hypothetical protein
MFGGRNAVAPNAGRSFLQTTSYQDSGLVVNSYFDIAYISRFFNWLARMEIAGFEATTTTNLTLRRLALADRASSYAESTAGVMENAGRAGMLN